MNTRENMNSNVKQILVVFDSHRCNQLSLNTIVKLASSLNANVRGLYIENVELLYASDLPFVREINLHSAVSQEIDRQKMAKNLRSYADRIRKLLSEYAKTARIEATFEFIQSQGIPEIFEEAINAQLIVFPAVQSLWISRRSNNHHVHNNLIVVLIDGTASSENALHIATSMAEKEKAELLVLSGDSSFEDIINDQLKELKIKTTVKLIDQVQMPSILDELKQCSPGLFITPESSELVKNDNYLRTIISRLGCDIVVVR